MDQAAWRLAVLDGSHLLVSTAPRHSHRVRRPAPTMLRATTPRQPAFSTVYTATRELRVIKASYAKDNGRQSNELFPPTILGDAGMQADAQVRCSGRGAAVASAPVLGHSVAGSGPKCGCS